MTKVAEGDSEMPKASSRGRGSGRGCAPSPRKFFEYKKDIWSILGYLKVTTASIVFFSIVSFLKYAICLTLMSKHESVADVVRRDRVMWFGHLEH